MSISHRTIAEFLYKADRYDELNNRILKLNHEIESKDSSITTHNQAEDFIQNVSREIKNDVKERVNVLLNIGLQEFLPDKYAFSMDFIDRRGQTEVVFSLKDSAGNEFALDSAVGGGVVDLISFCLRVVFWSLMRPRTRPVFILDEPFRFVSTDKQHVFSHLLQGLKKKYGIQFIIITHDETFQCEADKTFSVSHDGERSVIIESETEE
jgi:DNA repair ATPase RecN